VKPDLDTAAASLANIYIDGGRLDDGLAVAKQGLAAHPGSAPLHEAMGLGLAAQGQKDLATKEFEEAIKIAPRDPEIHMDFAHWLNAWRVRGAAFHLDRALELTKDDMPLLVSIGHEYRLAASAEGPDVLGSCLKAFDRALQIKDTGEGRTERALCKLAMKDEKGCLEDLQTAIRVEPDYPTAHYYLAGRFAVQKHYKEAAAEYQRYLQLAPQGSLAKTATERLKLVQDAMKKK
jgi:Tfp pilus assembly protein PilF